MVVPEAKLVELPAAPLPGTLTSIFIASAVLVEWYKAELRGFKISHLLRRGKKNAPKKSK
jgi:hypothetical protein